jgi:hypothetical protein
MTFEEGAEFLETGAAALLFPAADFIPPSIESTTFEVGIGHM